MCLGIPGEIVEILADREDLAMVSVEGVKRVVNIGLLEDEPLVPGDWILIHVGFALSKIDEREAKASLEWLTGIGEAYTDELAALAESDIDMRCVHAVRRRVPRRRDGPRARHPDRRAVRAGPALQVHGGVRRATPTRSTSTGWRTTCPRPSRWCTAPAARCA